MAVMGSRNVVTKLGLALLGAVVVVGISPVVAGQRPEGRRIVVGSGAHLGVVVRDLEPQDAERQKVQGGAVVEDVRHDGPADKAGVKKGDVIVEFDGERIRSARQLTRIVEETVPGRSVKAAVLRDGRRTDVSITPAGDRISDVTIDTDRVREQVGEYIERLPHEFSFDFDVDGFNGRGRLGVTVIDLTPQRADYLGTKEGVLVSSVNADSPAAKAGLKAGDVITQVDGAAVRSRADLVRALRAVHDDAEASIDVVREKRPVKVKAKLEGVRRPVRSAGSGRPA
jgi:serine protease Do